MANFDENQKLAQFIDSKSKYIFHFYGEQNTRKSEIVRKTLIKRFQDEYNKQVIWVVTGYEQTNMVIEHWEDILKKPLSNPVPQSYSNLRNIHILTQGLQVDMDEDKGPGRPYVLVIDKAEKIFSLHLSSDRKNSSKEVVEQWRVFLKSLIELNSCGKFSLKVILITNKHILDLEDMEKFLEYDENIIDSKDESNHEVVKNADAVISGLVQTIIEGCNKEDCDAKIIKPSLSLINRVLNSTQKEEFYNEVLKKHVRVELRDYIDVGDVIHQYGYGMELIEAIDEIEKEKKIDKFHSYVPNYIMEQAVKIWKLAMDIRNIQGKKQEVLGADIKNIKIIKRMYSVFDLISIFKKAGNIDQKEEKILFYNSLLMALLRMPLDERFNDVGGLLRTYGYSSLLFEMIVSAEPNDMFSGNGREGEDVFLEEFFIKFQKITPQFKIADFKEIFQNHHCTQTRINILKGNIGFYNYPEDYVQAMDNYCKVFELKGDGSGALNEYRFLATYEIINVLFQLAEKWEVFLSFEQKEGINKHMVRLTKIFREENPGKKDDVSVGAGHSLDTPKSLLKATGALIQWLERQEAAINKPSRAGTDTSTEGDGQMSGAFSEHVFDEIETILNKLKRHDIPKGEAFFERTLVARIKYGKLKTKSLISNLAKNNQINTMGLSIKAVNDGINNLKNTLEEPLKCQSYWKFSIIYHLTKWLYFLANAVTSAGSFSSGAGFKEKINVRMLMDINYKYYGNSHSLWREAKIKDLAGDIMRLNVKQTRNDKERLGHLKERISSYNEARKIYLTLNSGHQLESILEKINQAEALLRAGGNYSSGDEYERTQE